MKLSIIVPVYNVEKYLERCVESLLRQDLDDYEIILVNDCSTDGSGALCDKLAAHSERIRIIHHSTNQGAGVTRNTGLDNACGEYILFVDSDDYLDSNSLLRPYKACVHNMLEILGVCSYIKHLGIKKTTTIISLPGVQEDTVITGKEYLLKKNSNPSTGPCFYFFRKDFLDNRGLRFPEDRFIEDAYFIVLAIALAKRIAFCKLFIYNYMKTPGSLTVAWNAQKSVTMINVAEKLANSIENLDEYTLDEKAVLLRFTGKTAFSGLIHAAGRGLLSRDILQQNHATLTRLLQNSPISRTCWKLVCARRYGQCIAYCRLAYLPLRFKKLLQKFEIIK